MLQIVGTPIGNLKDVTERAINLLASASIIVCEDTREAVKLLKAYNIPQKPLISFYEEVEVKKTDEILQLAVDSQVALITDSGMPLISDPGYKLVREAIRRDIKVECAPGVSAFTMALVLSGLPPDKFMFLGYPPEKPSHEIALYSGLKNVSMAINCTYIFYVSPHKLVKNLSHLAEVFGDISVVLCRELTKIYEETWRGKISEAQKKFHTPRGEFVLLFNLKSNK